MKQKLQKLMMLAIVLLCPSLSKSAFAQYENFSVIAPTGQTLYYIGLTNQTLGNIAFVVAPNRNESYYVWNGYTTPTGHLEIPSSVTYNGIEYTVISIDNNCFHTCGELTSVTIPATVVSISRTAFNGSGVTSLTLMSTTPPGNETTEASPMINSSVDTIYVPCNAVNRYIQHGMFSVRQNHSWIPEDLTPVVLTSHTTCAQDFYDYAVTFDIPNDGSVILENVTGTVDSVYSGIRAQYIIKPETGFFLDSIFVDGINQSMLLEGQNPDSVAITFDTIDTDHTIRVVSALETFRTYTIRNIGGGAMIVKVNSLGGSVVHSGLMNDTTISITLSNNPHQHNGLELRMGTWASGVVTFREWGSWDPLWEETIPDSAVQLNHFYVDGTDVLLSQMQYRTSKGPGGYILYLFESRDDTASHSFEAMYGPLTDTATCPDIQATSIAVSAIGTSRATITWEDNYTDGLVNYYKITWIDTSVIEWDGNYWSISNTVSGRRRAVVDNLSLNKTYQVYIETFCSNFGAGVASDTISFTTATADTTDITVVAEGTQVYFYTYNETTGEVIQPVSLIDSVHFVDYSTGYYIIVEWDAKPDTIARVYMDGELMSTEELEAYHTIYQEWDFYQLFFNAGERGEIRVVFEPISNDVTITANTYNPSMGNVMGSGVYFIGSNAQLLALPFAGYGFTGWADGNMDNPRLVNVACDSTFVAQFSAIIPAETIEVHDTTIVTDTVTLTEYVPVHDTTYIDVPYAVHDTTYIDVPYAVHDTTIVTDTVTLTEYVPVHDTTYIDVPYAVHDTTYINVPYAVHDTTIVTDTMTLTEYVPVHDTTYIDVPYAVHDTTIVTDTVTLTEYVPVHDTTIVTVTDTVINTVFDTVTNTVYDTVTNTLYDTIDNYIYDTTIVTDTLWLTLYDTVYITDTIIIHDTVYVPQDGIGDVETLNAKVYAHGGQIVVEGADGNRVTLYDVSGRVLAIKHDEYTPLRFDAPASGTYMIKIGDYPARKVVVIR